MTLHETLVELLVLLKHEHLKRGPVIVDLDRHALSSCDVCDRITVLERDLSRREP